MPETREQRTEEEWAGLKVPDETPAEHWPYTILFVGANNQQNPQLKLQAEYNAIKEKLGREFQDTREAPRLEPIPYSTWFEVLDSITNHYPTAVHFGCHSEKNKGLALFRQIVDPGQMIPAIRAHNRLACKQGKAALRFIITNS